MGQRTAQGVTGTDGARSRAPRFQAGGQAHGAAADEPHSSRRATQQGRPHWYARGGTREAPIQHGGARVTEHLGGAAACTRLPCDRTCALRRGAKGGARRMGRSAWGAAPKIARPASNSGALRPATGAGPLKRVVRLRMSRAPVPSLPQRRERGSQTADEPVSVARRALPREAGSTGSGRSCDTKCTVSPDHSVLTGSTGPRWCRPGTEWRWQAVPTAWGPRGGPGRRLAWPPQRGAGP